MNKSPLTTRADDYSQWYLDVIDRAGLAENSSVRGCMVIKPNGYAIWERMQRVLDDKFKEFGVQNAYFPLFIPKSFLSKEAKHVEGFAQESAIITHYRLKTDPVTKEVVVDPTAKLEEELIVRPTSETIMYDTFSRWIESWRDLPLLINQWANVVRWEMRTRLFLRTAEFLWQEGHTAHATHDEADQYALKMLEVYRWFAEEIMAIPVVVGEKTESERFAGALGTYCIEALVQDGKAIQAGTSHNLGQNFAKAFDVQFSDRDGQRQHVWQTSWGMSTRMIGALIMTHSDDNGLVLPPRLAPIQVAIVPIGREERRAAVMTAASKLRDSLKSDVRVHLDERDYLSPGELFNDWEKRGVPIRLELGTRDLEQNQVTLVRRDTGEKTAISIDAVASTIPGLLEKIQVSLFERAKAFRQSHTHTAATYDEFKQLIETQAGFVWAHWDGTPETEARIKEETKATVRCMPFDRDTSEGSCIVTGKPSKGMVLFAKAY